ncbi:VirB4 family type IV secretion system protein [Cedecea davisae]|uniref:VirB4 family type IV secretion system protein n=1 Tax=Cedecea davisae TaxID=158484 RepID=UPI001C0ED4CA|nr:AAA family ATPase [Cedecea davisae]MBU4685550.1 VirB4 family type IV secretion system protein [Cedecea davisae]
MPSGQYNEQLALAGHENDVAFTYTGSVIGGLSLQGLDPSSVTESMRKTISLLIRNVIQLLPANVTLSQYYVHFEGAKVKLAARENPRSQLLSKRRQAFLNKVRNLNDSRLFWLIEVSPDEDLNSIFSTTFFKNLFNGVFDEDARKRVGLVFKERDAFKVEVEEFEKQCRKLKDTLNDLQLRLSFFSPENEELGAEGIWKLQKFLANFNPRYMTNKPTPLPVEDWDHFALDGENVTNVMFNGVPMLKIDGAQPVYLRIASVTQFGKEHVPEAVWSVKESGKAPVMAKGNYVYFTRYAPASSFKRSLIIAAKENELVRNQIKLTDLMSNKIGAERLEGKIKANPHLQAMQDELSEATYSADRLGYFVSCVAVFDTDPQALINSSKALDGILSNNMTLVWEGAGLETAYFAMQPGYPKATFRTLTFNTSQAGAASLFFRSHQGIKRWKKGMEDEEAIYILESDDGVPFYFTPVIGEKSLVVGVGPTRTGKSFFKNTIASHFTKIGGIYSSLDVDQGTIPLANFFKEDGAAFTLSDQLKAGMNTFSTAETEEDSEFIIHVIEQIKLMLQFNDREEDRTLSTEETKDLSLAVQGLLHQEYSGIEGRLSVNRLETLMSKCPSSIQNKMASFYGDGYYARLFDNEHDAIGKLDRPVSVYNLASVKDKKQLAQLLQHEIFFRTVRLFESAKYRETPKFMDIDEAQYTLSVPGAADWAIAKARTWFKHGGGMGFWTQNPQHYSSLDEWQTLRSSASVFVFMPDQEAITETYVEAFDLDPEEVEIIRTMKPKQQAYIIIPDLQIAKVVNLIVEAEQYVICTSKAHEAALAERTYQKHDDIDAAIDEILTTLNLSKTPVEDTDEEEVIYQ